MNHEVFKGKLSFAANNRERMLKDCKNTNRFAYLKPNIALDRKTQKNFRKRSINVLIS